jgi:hypothetical protein
VFQVDGQYAAVYIGAANNEGDIRLRDGRGNDVFRVDGQYAAVYVGAQGNEGDIQVMDNNGNLAIHLDGGSGDIRLLGADLAEEFSTKDPVDPGTVVVATGIDTVEASAIAYDQRVVGIVSGHDDLKPAVRMGRKPGIEGRVPVALAGRVYCKVDASGGPVAVGDLLTTSPLPGYAMRADAGRNGAIIGKALCALDSGTGLVPVLVGLQ